MEMVVRYAYLTVGINREIGRVFVKMFAKHATGNKKVV